MNTNRFRVKVALAVLITAGTFTFTITGSAQEARPRVGLVLSGGGARGFAHIGVLEWFEEHHIPVDYIAGTSMGGLIGGMYAMGYTPDEMKEVAFSIDWIDLFRPVPAYDSLDFRRKEDRRAFPNAIELGLRGGLKLPSGLNSGHMIGLLFSRLALPYSHIRNFDELPIPFRCMATDMVEARPIALSDGSLALALLSTMSIPGVFAPVEMENKVLTSDGGLLNNLPTDVMKEMRPDIIIAVDIGTPLGDVKSMSTLTGVLGQTIGVVTIENVRRNRELADILILPDLKTYATMDFFAGREITRLGYEGTEKLSADLQKFSLSDAEWQKHMEARKSRIPKVVPEPQFIQVTGTGEGPTRQIEKKLQDFVHKPVDTTALADQLTQIWGRGKFLRLGYQLTESESQVGLLVRTNEKSYAPPFLNLALELNNTRSDVLDVNLRGRVTFMDIGSVGSEVRLDGSLGSENSLAGEYYYRLRDTGFFVAPRAFTQKTKTGIFLNEEQVAQYNIREYAVGADVGYGFERTSEFRFGYEAGHLSASRSIGDPVLPEVSGATSEVAFGWKFDSVDSAVVPTRGSLLNTRLRYVFDSPVGEGSVEENKFAQFSFRGVKFVPAGKNNTIFGLFEGDTSFDNDPSAIEEFPVGGLFRVSGLSNDEFRGNHALIGTVGYLRKIADMPPLLGEKISVGAWYEIGSAFDDWDEADYFHSISVGGFVETILGPIFVGISFADQGRSNFYFAIGRFF